MAAHESREEPQSGSASRTDDEALVEALRRGDEGAFVSLIERYHSSMVRLACLYVSSQAAAEGVTQETWLAVLQGLNQFEGRSSLKTWIFRILVNRAKTRGQREGQSVPFSWLAQTEAQSHEPAVDSERFLPPDHPRWPHHWAAFPQSWEQIPEERLLSAETLAYIRQAIEALPASQREVITLRDVQGWPAAEVCNVLGITETNQRVLLHRARSRVRRALEQYLSRE